MRLTMCRSDGIKAKDALDELSLGRKFLNILSESQILNLNEQDFSKKPSDPLPSCQEEDENELRGKILKVASMVVAILTLISLAYFFFHS